MKTNQPSQRKRHETSSQERVNERKAEDRQIERLRSLLAKKIAVRSEGAKSPSIQAA